MTLDNWYEKYIDRRPGVCGGFPVVRGTRTPVRTVVNLHRQSKNLEDLQSALPHLSVRQIEAALAYYEHEPRLVDEDIERNEKALLEVQKREWRASA